MAERGVFAIDRGVFEHPIFKDEPFTEREAWMWMIGEAAWQPTRARVGRTMFDLKRGQFAHALRFMGGKWQWTESRVRRFLERLKNERMIDALPSSDATLITICKYDDYQFGRRTADAPSDGPATDRRRREEETEEGKNLDRGSPRARARGAVSEEAAAFADELARICRLDPEFLPPQWVSVGPHVRVQMMLNSGWRIDVMRVAAKAAVQRKRDGPPQSILYFDKIFARAHAPQLPLPPVPVCSQEAQHGPSTAGAAGYFREARATSRSAAHAALKDSIARDEAGGEEREEGGGQVIRLDRGAVADGRR